MEEQRQVVTHMTARLTLVYGTPYIYLLDTLSALMSGEFPRPWGGRPHSGQGCTEETACVRCFERLE
jgi:hypothetical protein